MRIFLANVMSGAMSAEEFGLNLRLETATWVLGELNFALRVAYYAVKSYIALFAM